MTSDNAVNYEFYQDNGQIKYGPPKYWTRPPPKDTEVIIKGITNYMTPSDILSVAYLAGEIYLFRLMVNFSGSNRGFCFVRYTTKEEAKTAIKLLRNYQIGDSKIRVDRSFDNCTLFVANIPRELNQDDVNHAFSLYTIGAVRVKLPKSADSCYANKGFCFVEFEDHFSASQARRNLLNKGIPGWGNLQLEWSVPDRDRPFREIKTRTIYISCMNFTTEDRDVQKVLLKHFRMFHFEKIKKIRDFCFVTFASVDLAGKAIEILDGSIIDGAQVCVSWAKGKKVFNSATTKKIDQKNEIMRHPHDKDFPFLENRNDLSSDGHLSSTDSKFNDSSFTDYKIPSAYYDEASDHLSSTDSKVHVDSMLVNYKIGSLYDEQSDIFSTLNGENGFWQNPVTSSQFGSKFDEEQTHKILRTAFNIWKSHYNSESDDDVFYPKSHEKPLEEQFSSIKINDHCTQSKSNFSTEVGGFIGAQQHYEIKKSPSWSNSLY